MSLLLALVLSGAPPTWVRVAPGVEYARFLLEAAPRSGDGFAHVVRIDSTVAKLDLALASQHGGTLRTAREWCDDEKLSVAINAGMYDTDYVSNVGYLRRGTHLNNGHWSSKYHSVLMLSKKGAVLFDRDVTPVVDTSKAEGVVQNLRLLKGAGESVWKPNGTAWSEALIADDAKGRVLFVFVQTPFEMAALNEKLLGLGLELRHAMHVEGGPEASLSIHSRAVTVDLAGGPRRSEFHPEDTSQWRIPNVIGVRAP